MVWVKICGVTGVEDALGCVEAGADAVGINFYERSPRHCSPQTARAIVEAVGTGAVTVGIFVDKSYEEIVALRESVGFELAQLHGSEPPELLDRLLPRAYKAIRVRGDFAARQAGDYGGETILLDAYVPGIAGGTGKSFDWGVAARVAATRRVILAGGLNPDNVSQAIARVAPYGVDAASGVESAPGKKQLDRVRAFVEAARGAG
jgi:phosphoribosylanthranilate isomerase